MRCDISTNAFLLHGLMFLVGSVVLEQPGHHTGRTAYEVAVPSEVSGQLIAGDEQDWYAIAVRRGEVIHLERFIPNRVRQ